VNATTAVPPGGGSPPEPVGPYHVDALSIEDGMDIAMWRSPGPWAVNDALEAPRADEGYWAIRAGGGELVGFCCFGEAARVPGLAPERASLDVAFGLRPDLVGRGLSAGVARAVVDHARRVAEGNRLRCVVATWNGAGRRATETAGFQVCGAHQIPGGGPTASFLVFAQD
jgi:RimJ/RimL family protein N-acetyltransferase